MINAIYYERDKNNAHKDTNYKAKQYSSLDEIANEMIQQLKSVRNLCSENLPDVLTLNFVAFDSELFRIAHGVTMDLEEKISDEQHPLRKMPFPEGIQKKEIPLFNDTEELKNIPEDKRKEYGALLQMGICMEESLQRLQDGCIRINVLFDLDIWVTISEGNFQKQKHYRKIGLFDEFDRPIIPPSNNREEFDNFLKKLSREGIV